MGIKEAIESVLFLHGEPLTIRRLVKLVGAPKREVEALLKALAADYRSRGIMLIRNEDTWQFVTNPAHKRIVERLIAGEFTADLTKPALEVLAVVAYKGPVSRAVIEYIRGVNSASALRSLLLRGLVDREVNPKDRRSYLYRATTDLLKYLGISEPEELPRYREFRSEPAMSPEAIAGEPGKIGGGESS